MREETWDVRRVVRSVKHGRWSDPTTWDVGEVPRKGDRVVIEHEIEVDSTVSLAGLWLSDA